MSYQLWFWWWTNKQMLQFICVCFFWFGETNQHDHFPFFSLLLRIFFMSSWSWLLNFHAVRKLMFLNRKNDSENECETMQLRTKITSNDRESMSSFQNVNLPMNFNRMSVKAFINPPFWLDIAFYGSELVATLFSLKTTFYPKKLRISNICQIKFECEVCNFPSVLPRKNIERKKYRKSNWV